MGRAELAGMEDMVWEVVLEEEQVVWEDLELVKEKDLEEMVWELE